MSLDFSFLSCEGEGEGAPIPPPFAASAVVPAQTAPQSHQMQPAASSAKAPPIGVEPCSSMPSLDAVPDSWTLWDCSAQRSGFAGNQASSRQADAGLANSDGVHAAPQHSGGTSFTRAFAHMKERPSFEPSKPAVRQIAPGASSTTPNARAIQVSRRQKNNPVLRSIRNVPWEFAEIVADYQMGTQTCCLFLSLRYHLLKPKYIYTRMEGLQRGYRLRVLLCLVDTEDNVKTLIDVHKATAVNGWTLILAWSPEEAARYLETYQTYEHKQADNIQQRVEGDYLSRLTDALTTIRSVNRTDVATLSTSLGSLANIMAASKQRLALCPGVGDKKVQRIFEAFHEPFLSNKRSRHRPEDEAVQGAQAKEREQDAGIC
jgi:DNA repair protein Rad10